MPKGAAKSRKKLTPNVYEVSVALENWAAQLKLGSMGIRMDTLTKERANCLPFWDHGMSLKIFHVH